MRHSGGGYSSNEKADLFKRFKALEIKRSPFVNTKDILIDTKVHLIDPILLAEFEISDKTTAAGIIRHPAIFKGLRGDKKAEDVVPELPIVLNIAEAVMNEISGIRQNKSVISEERKQKTSEHGGSWETLEKVAISSKEVLEVEGKNMTLTNIDRHVWKGVTKAELIHYYISVSDYILLF